MPEFAVGKAPSPEDRREQTTCPFCQQAFTRSDTVRRHARICRLRGNRALPPNGKRGRKLHACDACSRVKVSCNSKMPCRRCSSRALTCTYGRLFTDPSQTFEIRADDASTTIKGHRLNLTTLLKWTDPTTGTLSDVVAEKPDSGSERELEPRTEPYKHHKDPMDDWIGDTIDPRLLFLGLLDLDPEKTTYHEINDSEASHVVSFSLPTGTGTERGILSRMDSRMLQLSTDLRQLAIGKPRLQTHFNLATPRTFLTGANCCKFITAYSRRRYFQSAIIHWPTFDLEQTTLPLILASMLVGATYIRQSDSSVSFSSLKAMHELADRYIFKQVKELTNLGLGGDSLAIRQDALELCQAAFLVNWLHVNFNDNATHWIFITRRHPLLVGTLRKLELLGMKHEWSKSWQEWHAFIYRETCIRLVSSTFLLDSLLTVYYNHPPLLSLSEMSGHLPCDEDLWDASSSDSFQEQLSNGHPKASVPCLKDVVTGLLSNDWTNEMIANFDLLNVHHLHAIIGALQPMIFNCQASLLLTTDLSVFLAVLDRWEQLWDRAIDRVPEDQRQWLGVAGHSRELAWLTRRIIEGLIEGDNSKYLQRTAVFDTKFFHQFIQQVKLKY